MADAMTEPMQTSRGGVNHLIVGGSRWGERGC